MRWTSPRRKANPGLERFSNAAGGDRFARVLKTRHVLTLAFGAMIGWSWVLMTGYWVGNAGSVGTLLAFAAGGLVIGFIALTYAELASAMPRAGGEHVYTHAALGPGWSFVCTWALLMAYVTVCVFESVALPTAVEYLIPAIRMGELWQVAGAPVDGGFVLVGLAGAVTMTAINLLGIRTAAIVQGIVTTMIFVSGVVLFSGAVGFGSPEMASPPIAVPATGILSVLIMGGRGPDSGRHRRNIDELERLSDRRQPGSVRARGIRHASGGFRPPSSPLQDALPRGAGHRRP